MKSLNTFVHSRQSTRFKRGIFSALQYTRMNNRLQRSFPASETAYKSRSSSSFLWRYAPREPGLAFVLIAAIFESPQFQSVRKTQIVVDFILPNYAWIHLKSGCRPLPKFVQGFSDNAQGGSTPHCRPLITCRQRRAGPSAAAHMRRSSRPLTGSDGFDIY